MRDKAEFLKKVVQHDGILCHLTKKYFHAFVRIYNNRLFSISVGDSVREERDSATSRASAKPRYARGLALRRAPPLSGHIMVALMLFASQKDRSYSRPVTRSAFSMHILKTSLSGFVMYFLEWSG